MAATRSCWSTYFGNGDSDDNNDDEKDDDNDDDDEKNDDGDEKNGEKFPVRIFLDLQQDQHFPTQS